MCKKFVKKVETGVQDNSVYSAIVDIADAASPVDKKSTIEQEKNQTREEFVSGVLVNSPDTESEERVIQVAQVKNNSKERVRKKFCDRTRHNPFSLSSHRRIIQGMMISGGKQYRLFQLQTLVSTDSIEFLEIDSRLNKSVNSHSALFLAENLHVFCNNQHPNAAKLSEIQRPSQEQITALVDLSRTLLSQSCEA